MRTQPRLIRSRIEDLPPLQRCRLVRYFYVISRRSSARVGQQLGVIDQQSITKAKLAAFLSREQLGRLWHLDDRKLWRALRLAVEQVGDGSNRVKLERLVGVELQFHGRPRWYGIRRPWP